MRIDAHQHFWERERFDYRWLDPPAMQPIQRDFLPADLRPLIEDAGIDRTILVQTQHNLAENDWALGLAERHDFVAGVVGWVDLASPECQEQLLRYLDHPKFVGIRHITQDEPDDDFIVRSDVVRGLQVLQRHEVPFDLLFYERHLRHAATLARQLPSLRMVIDHLAKPQIRDGERKAWEAQLRSAARYPNLYCKLSGMVTEADHRSWKVEDLRPFVEIALEAFGPERLMFGSDWPVCLLAASYRQVHDAAQTIVGDLSPAEQARIFGGTAAEFYRLDR